MAAAIELSIVVPVFNAGNTISGLVDEIQEVFSGQQFEILLVNDGSTDGSEQTCAALSEKCPSCVSLIQLSRNFGEHNAVMAGLSRAQGRYVGVLDDDGQNPPSELARLYQRLQETGADLVYGRYIAKQHGWFRNLCSRLNDRTANVLLNKPGQLYLSSFKVMRRQLVDEILKYQGPFPYLDALILRTTNQIEQIDVVHRERVCGRSGYTLQKLMQLWLNMFFGASTFPWKIFLLMVIVGAMVSAVGIVALASVFFDVLQVSPGMQVSSLGLAAAAVLCSGIQLVILGVISGYVWRLALVLSGMPPYVIRYQRAGGQTC